MAVFLKDILKMPECADLKLVAGKKGANREVRWTAVIGTIDLIKFSNEGDLDFVSGAEVYSTVGILRLIKEAYEYNMAGIVFAPGGPLLSELPKEALAFGDENDFPILVIPWHTKISDWTKKIGQLIIVGAKNRRTIEDLLKFILLGKVELPIPQEIKKELSDMGFLNEAMYRVILFQMVKGEEASQEDYAGLRAQLSKQIASYCQGRGIMIRLSIGYAAVLRGEHAQNMGEKELHSLATMAAKLHVSCAEIEVRVGVGQVYENIENISHSYNEAALVTNLISVETQALKNIYCYEQLGAYRILWECANKKTAMDFSEEHLENLRVYDRVNGTDLMDFLKNYFKHNSNAKDVSEKMYLHKNTVLYRAKKVESILGCDFSLRDDYFNIQLALMIDEIYNQKRQTD